MIFLTRLDPDITPSGSARDPLGQQPVWSFFGRRLIPTLTSVSTNSHSFSTLLVSLYCREKWLEARGEAHMAGADPLVLFELLHIYTLLAAGASDLGGTPGERRAKVRWKEQAKKPLIGPEPEHQVLRNQAGTGISGRYYTPLVRMGVVDDSGRIARDVSVPLLFGERVDALRHHVHRFFDAVEAEGPQVFSAFKPEARSLMLDVLPLDIHSSSAEVEFWKDRIGITGSRHPLVRRCAATIQDRAYGAELTAEQVMMALLRDQLPDSERQVVLDVLSCEAFLAPLHRLFDTLYRARTVSSFLASAHVGAWVEQLRNAHARFSTLPVPAANPELHTRFKALCEVSPDLDGPQLAERLVEIHCRVMQSKSGTPWLAIENQRLVLLNPAYQAGEGQADGWVNWYYISSLAAVLAGLNRGSRKP